MSISAAISAYNEGENIGRCLESIAPWVDEIVFVDGKSSDNTVAVAKRYGVKVITAENEEMFHKNKQLAIDKCTGEWILQLDADEVVPDNLRKEIIATIEKSPDQNIAGYWIPRKNFFLGKYLEKGGQYPDYTLRLYRNGKGRLPCKSIHEQAVVEGRTDYLHKPLLHNAYPNFSHYLQHFNQYTSIAVQDLREQKTTISFVSFLIYFFIKPLFWFLRTYIRHKGFKDGFPGFVFSLFSSARFPVTYIKYWAKTQKNNG